TRPSIPMMKLMVTALFKPGMSSRGLGVVKASGGFAASQLLRTAARAMVEKLEFRTAPAPSFRSLPFKERLFAELTPALSTDARQPAASAATPSNKPRERSGISFIPFESRKSTEVAVNRGPSGISRSSSATPLQTRVNIGFQRKRRGPGEPVK